MATAPTDRNAPIQPARKDRSSDVRPVQETGRPVSAAPGDLGDLVHTMYMLTSAFDMHRFLDMHRRNLEMLAESGQVVMNSVQAIVGRQTRLFNEAMDGTLRLVADVAAAREANPAVGKHLELVRALFDNAMRGLQEINEVVQKSNQDSAELIQRRAGEAMAEIQKIQAGLQK
jgi:phasin family protein